MKKASVSQTLPFALPALRRASQQTCKIITDALADEGALGPFDTAKSALKALYAAT